MSGKKKVVEELHKILNKDPIIATKRAEDIRDNPNGVKNYYDASVCTHMPIGQTDQYLDKMLTWITVNKGALVGGVVGGYGLGKTSIMLYFWQRAQEHNIVAVPPYSWKDLQDHFDAAYYWTKFYLKEIKPASRDTIRALDGLYDKYRMDSVEALAKKWSKDHGIDFERAKSLIEGEVRNGKLRLENSPEELLEFYSELSKLLKEARFEGFIAFTDELQQTIAEKAFKEIAGEVFRVANGILSREGNFGIFFGMPKQTQAWFTKERKDVLDRLLRQGCFVDLNQLYDQSFPENLWAMYVKYFDLGEVADKVVDGATLVSMNQVCDIRRPDLGNGPRSVVSAFVAMVKHFEKHNSSYSPTDFVDDCLSGRVELGDKSRFASVIRDILALNYVKGKYVREVKFLAAFPLGTSSSLEETYDMKDGVGDFLKESGGFGKLIMRSGGQGHALKGLQPPKISEGPENPLEEYLSGFYEEFSVDLSHQNTCARVFIEEIISSVYFTRNPSEVVGWIRETDRWTSTDWGHQISLVGTFNESLAYPFRRIRLEVVLPYDEEPPALKLSEDDLTYKREKDPIDFVFRFEMNWQSGDGDSKGYVEVPEWPSRVVKVVMNPFLKATRNIDQIHQSIPLERCDSFLYLNLMGYMSDVSEMTAETKQIWASLKSNLIKEVVNSLFNESMLDVRGAEVDVSNWGERLLRDVFKALCEANYPDYRTIMSSRIFQRKINLYRQILNNQEISLSMKRGKEPLRNPRPNTDGDNVKHNRNYIASLFGLKGPTGFDEWISELGPLVDATSWASTGEIVLTLHPLEQEILDGLEKSEQKRTYSTKECRTVKSRPFLKEAISRGYRYDEIRVLMEEIGPARKIFALDTDKGLVYRLPGTFDEDKKELQETWNKLEVDMAALSASCADFQARLLRELGKQVEKAADEEALEKAQARLREERDHIDFFIKDCLTRKVVLVKGKLEDVTLSSTQQDSRINRSMRSNPDGSAVWLESLAKIQQRLIRSNSNLRKEITSIQRDMTRVDGSADRFRQTQRNLDVKEFLEVYNDLNGIKTKIDRLSSEWTVFMSRVSDLENWISIASLYKSTFEKANSIEQSMGVAEIRVSYEKTSQELREFLEDELENGLKQYEGWKSKIQSICDRADTIVGKCRSSYMEHKSRLSQALKKAAGREIMIRAGFEESDVQNSYYLLGSEVSDNLLKILSELRIELKGLSTDARYAARFLDLSQEIDKCGLIVNVDSAIDELAEIERAISPETFTEVDNPEEAHRLAETVDARRTDLGRLTGELRRMLAPKPVEEDSREFLEIVSTTPQCNLKDVILQLKDRKDDLTLEQILDILKKCFIRQQIDVNLKRKS